MARLDERGVLLVEPGEEEATSEWFGESVGNFDIEVEPEEEEGPVPVSAFESVCIGDEIVTVGDFVYLTPDAKDEPCEICRIEAMYDAHATNQKYIEVTWFWRPEHIDWTDQPPHDARHAPSEREIFISECVGRI
jgi:hypothetical protein